MRERARERGARGRRVWEGGGGILITYTTVKTEGCYHRADILPRTKEVRCQRQQAHFTTQLCIQLALVAPHKPWESGHPRPHVAP